MYVVWPHFAEKNYVKKKKKTSKWFQLTNKHHNICGAGKANKLLKDNLNVISFVSPIWRAWTHASVLYAWLYCTGSLVPFRNYVFVEKDFGNCPCSVQLHGTCRIDSELLCVTRPLKQYNCHRLDKFEIHRKSWHKCCISAHMEILRRNAGK